MISRVAESCFWLSRYSERADTLARLIDVNLAFILDVDLPAEQHWLPLVTVVGEGERFAELVGASADPDTTQGYLVWDERNPTSLSNSIYWARENARTIRETISLEMWEAINDLWHWLQSDESREIYKDDAHAFFAHVTSASMLFHGLCLTTMSHDEAFDFMRLGTALERAQQVARIMDVKYHSLGPTGPGPETSLESAQWLAILRSCSAVESFHKRSASSFDGPSVAAFLALDVTFPRSIRHNVERALNFLSRIQDAGGLQGRTSEAEVILEDLRVVLAGHDKASLVAAGLHEMLTEIVNQVANASAAVERQFFSSAVLSEDGATQTQ